MFPQAIRSSSAKKLNPCRTSRFRVSCPNPRFGLAVDRYALEVVGRGWAWFSPNGASGNRLAGAVEGEGEGGSFAPGDREALTSLSAIFLPVLAAGGVWLGPRSMFIASGAARWVLFALSFRFRLAFFLVPGLPALCDLLQGSPGSVDVSFFPRAYLPISHSLCFC